MDWLLIRSMLLRYSSVGLKFVVSHDSSVSRSFLRSISKSLALVYYSGVGLVTRVKRRQRKYSLPTIVMHVGSVFEFAWMRWYAASRSAFLIRVCFELNLRHMAVIVQSILNRHKPWKYGWGVPLSTRLFIDSPEGLGKDQ